MDLFVLFFFFSFIKWVLNLGFPTFPYSSGVQLQLVIGLRLLGPFYFISNGGWDFSYLGWKRKTSMVSCPRESSLARVEVHNYSGESNNVAHVLARYGLMHEVRNILFDFMWIFLNWYKLYC